MKRKWLEEYAIVPKVILVILFFFWLDGAVVLKGPAEANTYNSKLDNMTQPRGYQGTKFEEWQQRRASVQNELKVVYNEAKAKGYNYNIVSYFQDLNRIMDLEDKYNINLTTSMPNALDNLHYYFYKVPENTRVPESQKEFVEQVQNRFGKRTGTEKSGPINWAVVLPQIFNWLVLAYFKLIFFWLLVYLIRFEENKMYQELSFKDELIICPSRFLLRILLWPRWCFAYPYHENTAEAMRYLKLKARFLQNKPFGYQLSEKEEIWLRQQARALVEEFEKALKSLREFKAPQLLKKSLATAYLSLFFGVLLQPAIVLAAKHSEKLNAHFYSQIQIVEVGHEMQFFNNHSADPPDESNSSWAIPVKKFEPEGLLLVWSLVIDLFLTKPQGVIKDIFHVPLARLFLGAAEVF
ncbi:MAG: hypothetical protein NT116_02420 [Candidatus Parcubacteria bacterium]|nr:hypothetical protein [Candidatus Parcubacteria bacterium]